MIWLRYYWILWIL